MVRIKSGLPSKDLHGMKITLEEDGAVTTSCRTTTHDEIVSVLQAVVRFADEEDLAEEFEEACKNHFTEKRFMENPEEYDFKIKRQGRSKDEIREMLENDDTLPEIIKKRALMKLEQMSDDEEDSPHEYMA